MTDVPAYIKPSEVATACSVRARKKMTRKGAKSLLARAGILERIGGHWMVGDSRLRERLPEVYDRVFAYFSSQPESDSNGPEVTQGVPAP